MFKAGDKVRIIEASAWPLTGMKEYLGKEGRITSLRDWFNVTKGNPQTLFFVDCEDKGAWCAEEQLELISAPKQTNSDYKSKCPCCEQNAYISFLGLIDCTNSSCPTKNPTHPRRYR